jgi:hypothetical protein
MVESRQQASDSEKSANAVQALDAAFASLHETVPKSNAEFRALVDGLDRTIPSQQALYAGLINLAPAFDQVTKAAQQTAAAAAQAAQAATTSAVHNWGSPGDVRHNDAETLQRTLAESGLTVDIQTILNSTKESVLAFYNSADETTKAALFKNQQAISDFVNKSGTGQGIGIGTGGAITPPAGMFTPGQAPGGAAVNPAIAEKAALQQQLDALTLNGIDLAKKQLEAQRALIQESNKALFDQVKAAELAKTNNAVQDQIDVLQGTKTARQLQVEQALAAAGDASTQALLKVKFALEDTAAVAKANASLQDQIDVLQGTSTARDIALKQALAGTTDASTQALIKLKFSLEDAAAVTARFQSATASLASNKLGMDIQLLTLNGDDAGAAALKRASDIKLATVGFTDAQIAEYTKQYDANVALANQIKAVQASQAAAASAAQASAAAAQQLKSAWQSVTDSIFSEVARIRGLMGTPQQSYASAQSAFAIATAQARAGDQDAAKALPGLSQALLSLAATQAASMVELRRIQGQTAASLELTGTGAARNYGLKLPSFDVGTDYVPYDMIAQIHEGERITPRAFNPVLSPNAGTGGDALLAEIGSMRQQLAAMQLQLGEANGHARRTANATNGAPESVPRVKVLP